MGEQEGAHAAAVEGQATAALVTHRSTEWISEHLADVSGSIFVSRLKDGLLYIESDCSNAVQEMAQKKDELQKYLNELQADSVHDIILQRTRNEAN